MLSQSQTINNFYKLKVLSSEYPSMKPALQQHSFEVFQFLEKSDLNNLRLANKFFNEICECHFLFSNSVKSLQKLFLNEINNEIQVENKLDDNLHKKSKFKEKFNFNRSMNELYKGSDILNERIQSGKRKKK